MAHRLKIRKGDTVKVITGKDKGKTGTVKAVEPKKNRVFVEGLNMTTRHRRPRTIRDAQRGGEVGGVIEKEGPIHLSNVMPLDPKDKKPTRVRIQVVDGVRVRVAARSRRRSAPSAAGPPLRRRSSPRRASTARAARRCAQAR